MSKLPFSRRFAGLVLALLLLPLLSTLVTAQAPLAPVDAALWDQVRSRGQVDALVILKAQADLEGARLLPTKEEKGWYVYRQLTAMAERTQPPLRAFLQGRGASDRAYWIRNMLLVPADAGLLLALAGRPEVARIEALPTAEPDPLLFPPRPAPAPDTVEWNIQRVHADQVWSTLGVTGTGVVVGNLDTGESYTHTALVRSYRGCVDPPACTTFDHNYNWFDGPGGSPFPVDYYWHGTHTLGTIVGDDGAGNQIGMAPGARWIACPGNPQEPGSPYLNPFDCFQFFLAPTDLNGQNPRPDLAPDVINCSWTWAADMRDIIHTLYLAGIFYSKSGGNTGPACGTTTNPGQYLEVTATGAFAQGDTIASFSSRGPVVVDYETVLKPDIAAPGVNVRSSVPGNQYAAYNGTSFSCPHTTGAVALILSARPELRGQIDTIQHILKSTAEPVVDTQCPPYVGHPNNVWGWGILDAYAAVQYAQGMALGRLQGTVTDAATGNPLAGVRVDIGDGAGWNLLPRETDGSGTYSSPLLPDITYGVTATLYGYLPGTATVTMPGGITITQDLSLSTAPQWTVSGTVVQTGTLLPLRATVLFFGTGTVAQTDPADGFYSATVYQGEYWTLVNSPGHIGQIVKLPIQGNRTDNYALTPIYNYYPRTSDEPCGPAFQWLDARDGTRACLGDNAFTAVNLGRDFTFYGNTYSNLYVGSNGIATFQLPANSYPLHIPDRATPNNGIYALGIDLNPGSCTQGEVFYKTVDNTFVLEYYQVQHAPSGAPETFEILLDFDTGLVTVQYLTVSNALGTVVGVENSTGTEATAYGGTVHGGLALTYALVFGASPYEQGTGALAGQVVVSGTGVPIPGAVVSAVDPVSATFTATTDLSGTYLLPLCANFYTATAAAAGYTPSTPLRVIVFSNSTTVQDFALEPSFVCEPVKAADFTWQPPNPIVGQEATFHGWASSLWYTETVDPAGVAQGGRFLAVDANGLPHLAYRRDGSLRYARFDGTAWFSETVDTGVDSEVVSIAVGAAGHPHIAYLADGALLAHAYYDGTAWFTETVGSTTPSAWPSLALDSAGRPHIAYTAAPDNDLEYAHFDGTTWATTTVDNSLAPEGGYLSLALDVADRPHIAYYHSTAGGIRYATFDGSSWQTETVEVAGYWDTLQSYTSLALDAQGWPRLSYLAISDYTDIRYAYKDAAGWHIEYPDPWHAVGLDSSLALDSAGQPYVVYKTPAGLKVAHDDEGIWQTEFIERGAAGVDHPALALDGDDRPHVGYAETYYGHLAYGRHRLAPTPPITYTWDLGDGTIVAGPSSITHTYAASGTYPVVMTATNACPSSATAAHTIMVLPFCAPAEIITVTAVVSSCIATFSAEVTGTEPLAYLWTFSDGMTSTEAMPTREYGWAGTYTGTLEVQNCGGTATRGFTVFVPCPLPCCYVIYLPLVTRGYTP